MNINIDEIARFVGGTTIGIALGLGIFCLCWGAGGLLYRFLKFWNNRKNGQADLATLQSEVAGLRKELSTLLQENATLRQELEQGQTRDEEELEP